MTSLHRISCVTMIVGGLAVLPCSAAVVCVNPAAIGSGDGSSWADAYTDLQTALVNTSAGNQIWVVAGTYTPGPPGDSVSSFVLKTGVSLYGGFVGGESSLSQRDWIGHVTTLSGDVGFDDVPGNLTTSNSGHVVVGSGVDNTAILDGFTISAGAYGPPGTPAGDPLLFGSGMYVVNGSPTVTNCTFQGNLAAFGHGGAAHLYSSNASFTHCTFISNHVHLGSGGAMFVGGASQPVISDCTFSYNVVTGYNGQEGQGGAIQNMSTLPLVIERCRFDHNQANRFSLGGIETPRGGGISSFALGSELTIRDCSFHHNSASLGGGAFSWNTATVINSTFDHNTALEGDGGGYACQWSMSTLVNCTIANNTAGEAAGVVIYSHPSLGGWASVRNCIIWGNVVTGQDVALRDRGIRGDYSADYCCIQDLLTAEPGEDPIDPENYPGCIVVNPQLMNAGLGDLRLTGDSPCIDAGRNADVPPLVLLDLDGGSRFVDDPSVADTGSGVPPLVDMGAFEHPVPVLPADITGDGAVGVPDLLAVINGWGTCPMPLATCPADIAPVPTGDGVVNVLDLLMVINNWGP